MQVTVGERDVSGAFRPGGPGLRGLVTGLPRGESTVATTLPDQSGARLVVRNAPQGGPVFSGPLWPSIFGHANPGNQITFTEVIPNSGEPTRACPGVPDEDVYDENSNPDGVRCTFNDYMRNVFGIYEDGPNQGKARRPLSNIGIQYGLSGLLSFLENDLSDPTRPPLTPDQFVALNANAGDYDLDFNRTEDGRRPTPRPGTRVPQRRRQHRGPPRRGGHHRPRRPRAGGLPRRLPQVLHAGPAHP